jgi:hypothetical protein
VSPWVRSRRDRGTEVHGCDGRRQVLGLNHVRACQAGFDLCLLDERSHFAEKLQLAAELVKDGLSNMARQTWAPLPARTAMAMEV